MKKIIIFVLILVILPTLVSASITENPIEFTLVENFYSTITKTTENGKTVFNYKNNLPTMDLTNNQLRTILNQKSGIGSSRLTYYETLNIKVKPVDGTPYQSLKGKTKVYRANGGGSWVSNINGTSQMPEDAELKDLNNAFWPYGFKLQYRTDPNDNFGSTIPNGIDLNNKTLEEQLATLLSIDLESNPNGVIREYESLWRFNPLPNTYNFLIRFDFLDEKTGTSPELKQGSTTEYLTSSLNPLGYNYVAIKYDRTNAATTAIITNENSQSPNSLVPVTVTSLSIISLLGVAYYLFKNNIIRI